MQQLGELLDLGDGMLLGRASAELASVVLQQMFRQLTAPLYTRSYMVPFNSSFDPAASEPDRNCLT
jgi:hypothetical protein